MFSRIFTQIFLVRAELALGNSVVAQNLISDAGITAKAIGDAPPVVLLVAQLEPELPSPLKS